MEVDKKCTELIFALERLPQLKIKLGLRRGRRHWVVRKCCRLIDQLKKVSQGMLKALLDYQCGPIRY